MHRTRQIIVSFTLCALISPALAYSAETDDPYQCDGLLYRAKTDNVPVYAEADETSEVLSKLMIGEKVCYVGEDNSSLDGKRNRKKFAVLDWRKESKGEKELAFAVLTDLWPPKDKGSKGMPTVGVVGVLNKAKNYMNRMRTGHPPSDALAPYREILGPATGALDDGIPEEGCSIDQDPEDSADCSVDPAKTPEKASP